MDAQELIRIRATQKGMSIVCDPRAAWPDVVVALRARLKAGARFYAGAEVKLDTGDRALSRADFDQIRSVVEDEFNLRVYSLICTQDALVQRAAAEYGCEVAVHSEGGARPGQPVPASPLISGAQNGPEGRADAPIKPDTVIVRHTCRSGASVSSPGNIVIIGNVNPGADVVAQHDIIVAGVLRGNAHAGAGGDTSAVIMALALEPKQLRIADKLGLPPASERPLDRSRPVFTPEIAYIEGDRIVVEPYTGRFPGT